MNTQNEKWQIVYYPDKQLCICKTKPHNSENFILDDIVLHTLDHEEHAMKLTKLYNNYLIKNPHVGLLDMYRLGPGFEQVCIYSLYT
jgi:hypothetical protein